MPQIFTVKPRSKIMQGGKALYGIEITLSPQSTTKQIWRSLDQYCILQKQIGYVAFDFEKDLENKMIKSSGDEQKLLLIVDFVNQCKSRPDVTGLMVFRDFFELEFNDFEYLDEWNRVNVEVTDMPIIDFIWSSKSQLLITLHKPTQTKKITNFFKSFLSKQSSLNGCIQIRTQSPKWTILTSITPQAQPFRLQYCSKSGMLFVSTDIGIYIYTVIIQGSSVKMEMIDFVKDLNIICSKFVPKTGTIFTSTPEKLAYHSITKQYTLPILQTNPSNSITSIAIDKNETRLYCSKSSEILIFNITQLKQIQQIACIENMSPFKKLWTNDKYLFGVSDAGYVSVLQVRPAGKERLMSNLTSIDIPANTKIFDYNEHAQMILTSNNQYIVLISSKNVPLFAGGNHKKSIVCGGFDQQSNAVIVADQGNEVVFYNVSFRAMQ